MGWVWVYVRGEWVSGEWVWVGSEMGECELIVSICLVLVEGVDGLELVSESTLGY